MTTEAVRNSRTSAFDKFTVKQLRPLFLHCCEMYLNVEDPVALAKYTKADMISNLAGWIDVPEHKKGKQPFQLWIGAADAAAKEDEQKESEKEKPTKKARFLPLLSLFSTPLARFVIISLSRFRSDGLAPAKTAQSVKQSPARGAES
jgi:hypothetical protein